MKIKHLPYHLGIIIPSSIILFNGATSYYAVFQSDPYELKRNFAIAYILVWVTYIAAILKSPGYTSDFKDPKGNYELCLKCNKPKPERAHHCKTCKRCVLRMDHHCPWTENCVGFENLPHFLRFLTAAALLCLYGLYRNIRFLMFVVKYRRHLKRVLPQTSRIYLCIASMIANAFMVLTLSLLWGRVIGDTVGNQTQIETWEIERIYVLNRRKMMDLVKFPFDVGVMNNLASSLGPWWSWFCLWSKPGGGGHVFERVPGTEGVRWPPREPEVVTEHEYYRKNRWISFEGETLRDYGVDE